MGRVKLVKKDRYLVCPICNEMEFTQEEVELKTRDPEDTLPNYFLAKFKLFICSACSWSGLFERMYDAGLKSQTVIYEELE